MLPAMTLGKVSVVLPTEISVTFPEVRDQPTVVVLSLLDADLLLEPAWVRQGRASLGELARTALTIQEACNGSGLAHGLAEVHSDLRLLFPDEGTEFFNRHPIVRLWIYKLADLARLRPSPDDFGPLYASVAQLAQER
jgi:hypothetical protein